MHRHGVKVRNNVVQDKGCFSFEWDKKLVLNNSKLVVYLLFKPKRPDEASCDKTVAAGLGDATAGLTWWTA